MRKRILNYVSVISMTILIILNGTISTYAYDIIGNDDKRLDILVINSYDSKNEWERHILYGFEESLKNIKPDDLELDIDYEYLDIRKRDDEEYIKSFSDLLKSKYKDKDIDFIFAVDDEAFNFMRNQVSDKNSIFYHKQLLFTGVNKTVELTKEEEKYITGIVQSNTKQLPSLIFYLHPEVDTLNILLDNSAHSQSMKDRMETSKNLFSRPVKVNFIQSDYIEDIQSQLKKINGENQAIILTGTFMEKTKDSPANLKSVVEDIKKVSNSPIYTNNYAYVSKGIIGGFVDVGEKQGEYIAKEIVNILIGESSNVSIISNPGGNYIFDYKEIYNYNVDPLKIPKDSIILNKPKHALLIPKTTKAILVISILLFILLIIYTIYKSIERIKEINKNKQLYEKAKEREQLKTDFIVNMSHEFRTPLNIILSTSKVTEMKINKDDYDNEYLLDKIEKINTNSKRLLKLVNNLIDITKYELGTYEANLENLNIVEVVEDTVLASVDYSENKQIDLIFDTEEEEIITAIDRDKIERVILNLVSNAIKFTHKCGKILVYMKKVKNDVIITVEDNGIGIAKDKVKEIFNRFYQVSDPIKKHEEGSGIGLCIVEEIIHLHKGQINVYSEVNKGSKFEVILPIYTVENSFENVQISNLKEIVKLEMSDIDTK